MFRSILAVAFILSPSVAAARSAGASQDQLDRLLQGRVAGRPTGCIGLSSITSSVVVPGKAIVYRVGSTLYVNEPRSGAETLDNDDILLTRSIGSRLCSLDTVHLVDRTSRITTGFVTLGTFVPYHRAK